MSLSVDQSAYLVVYKHVEEDGIPYTTTEARRKPCHWKKLREDTFPNSKAMQPLFELKDYVNALSLAAKKTVG